MNNFKIVSIKDNKKQMTSIFVEDGVPYICYLANTRDWNNDKCVEFGLARYDLDKKKIIGDYFNTKLFSNEYSNEFVEGIKKTYFNKQ